MSVGRVRVFAATSLHRSHVLQLMGQSARRHGLDCEIVEGFDYEDCDVAVVWGLPKNKTRSGSRQKLRHDIFGRHPGRIVVLEAPVIGRRVQQRRKRPWIVRKLFPADAPWTSALFPKANANLDRFTHYRIGFGAFPDEGALALAPYCTGRWPSLSRQLGLPEVRPYRKEGRHIMVMGQVPGDSSLRGADINQWILESCAALRRLTARPIIVRRHPLAADFEAAGLPAKLAALGVGIDDSGQPLAASLKDAWSVVTYSSGAAIDALIAGVPAVAMSPASFAWEVTDHELERALDPTLFERGPWLEKIAAAQWCEDEIASGAVWEPILRAIAAAETRAGAVQAA